MIHAERTHGGVKLRIGSLMAAVTNEQALQLADRLYALAGAEDAEDAEVIDYPEADREASRADWEYQFRKEQEVA